MSDTFYNAFFAELQKTAEKDEEKGPSKAHSAGMLGALVAGGANAARKHYQFHKTVAAPAGKVGIPNISNSLFHAAVAAPAGYLLGRGAYSLARRTKKHVKNLAKSEDKE